jgi:defect-in-organelle-trafficking protein DotB
MGRSMELVKGKVPPGRIQPAKAPPGPPAEALAFGEGAGGDLAMEELLGLMAWGRGRGMSDLILTSSDRPWMRVNGKWSPVGQRRVHLTDLTALLNRLTKNEAAGSMVGSGLEMDFGCELMEGRFKRLRFRGNATAVADGWSTGITVTLRALPERPPDLDSLGLEPELAGALFPDNGLVLVTGVMGSGKTTLLASALRRLAERSQRHIATYESPIEFDLTAPEGRTAPVEQTEIPRHLGGFAAAARNVTRRAADAVLIGESRDPQTMRGLLEAAEIGVTAYATVHSRSVADTPSRIIGVFGQRERPAVAATLLSAVRVIVQQRLYPAVGGGRRAVREFLVFDRAMRSALQGLPIPALGPAIERLVRERGQPLERAMEREVRAGRVQAAALEAVLAEKGRARTGPSWANPAAGTRSRH